MSQLFSRVRSRLLKCWIVNRRVNCRRMVSPEKTEKATSIRSGESISSCICNLFRKKNNVKNDDSFDSPFFLFLCISRSHFSLSLIPFFRSLVHSETVWGIRSKWASSATRNSLRKPIPTTAEVLFLFFQYHSLISFSIPQQISLLLSSFDSSFSFFQSKASLKSMIPFSIRLHLICKWK